MSARKADKGFFEDFNMTKTGKYRLASLIIAVLSSVVILSGCVERQLTIHTKPAGALVTLNDEEIGVSPVTVAFNWYGDYNVRLSKAGFETLRTHRKLKAPYYDAFPLDFFAETLWPGRIVDSYEWTFELAATEPVQREKLIQDARQLKTRATTELAKPAK